MSTLQTLAMYGRFMVGLPAHLRRRITLQEAESAILRGLEQRGANFLRIVRRGIYANPHSPYLPLLERAGCELGDLEAAVAADGVEPTLEKLRREGVYVTFEEYKGRAPIVRGNRSWEVDEHAFDNPLASRAYEGETGGSTGRATRVGTDLDSLFAYSPHMMVGRHVHGLLGQPAAMWKGELPDPVGVGIYLRQVPYRAHPEKWFTPVTRESYRPPLRFWLATRYILLVSRLCGVPCPRPEPLPLDRAVEVARWMRSTLDEHGGCTVSVAPSLAVRVALAADGAGIDLSGGSFLGGGEPFTAAKRASIEAVGARYVPLYISEDAGPMGLPCVDPVEENDQHLLADNLALIQHPREVAGSGVEVDAFYFTSLRHKAAKLLLNVESDDYGIVEERSCGCPLERLGYPRHLRRIRSFGKLTGEGVTLVGSEMLHILETVLPERFGGTPQDFQLLEEEDDRGFTRLTLLAHPRLEIEREQDLIDALLEAVKEGSDAGGLAQSFWRQAETFRVRRREPVWTARGKLPSIRVAALHDRPADGDGNRPRAKPGAGS